MNKGSGRYLRKLMWSIIVLAGIAVAVERISQREKFQIENATVLSEPAPSSPAGESRPSSRPTPFESGRNTNLLEKKANVSLAEDERIAADKKALKGEAAARLSFRHTGEAVFRQLPTIKTMISVTAEEAHGVPRVVQEAGAGLGQIAQSLENDPRLASDGVQFYMRCYRNSSFIPQVRALCLADARNLRKQNSGASFPTEDLSGVPLQVIQLSKQIPE